MEDALDKESESVGDGGDKVSGLHMGRKPSPAGNP